MNYGKPLQFACCETADWEISEYPVIRSILRVAESSFRMNIVDRDRDVVDGSIRYRHFGEWVVTFQLTETKDNVLLTVLRISMLENVSASKNALKKLWKITTIVVPLAKVAEVIRKRDP